MIQITTLLNISIVPLSNVGERMPGELLKPGDKVPTTGIYIAKHRQHRLPHEVFAVEGEEFPSCRKCGSNIRFGLVQSAAHIDFDRDFSKSQPDPPKRARPHRKIEEK